MENSLKIRFSSEVTSALRKAGWFEGRKIDTKEIVSKLKETGMNVFPAFLFFIEEFNGLGIEVNSRIIMLDVQRGIKELKYMEFLNDFKKVIKCNELAIVGAATTDWTILIDDSSNIYIVDTQNISCCGKGDVGIENLIQFNKFTEFDLPDWWWEKY